MSLSCGLLSAIMTTDQLSARQSKCPSVCLMMRKLFRPLDRQILILVSLSGLLASLLQTPRKIWTHDWDIVRKSSYRLEELAKQYEDAVNLDEKPDQRPAKEDEDDACDESCRALDFLAAREEEEGSLDSE